MKTLSEIVDILTKSGYLNATLINNQTIEKVKFLQLGKILLDNIRKEWLHSRDKVNTYLIPTCSGNENDLHIKLDSKDYLKSEKFREDFLYIKNNFQKELPLLMKDESKFSNIVTAPSPTSIVNLPYGTLLSSNYFFNETAATEQFYRIQRERKIWWMKLSPNPGRYALIDLKSEQVKNYAMQSVKIASKFEFGNLELERIEQIPLKAIDIENIHQFTLKDTRLDKRVTPVIIRSEFCLETAALGLLFDSVENNKRKISVHRKISPYQCSIFCYAEDDKILLELEELATHLANVIRKSGISVLALNKCNLKNEKLLQKEIIEMDKIGVPYSLILEHSSIKDGLMKFRSRDTSISEIIHITDVPDYLLKIVNS